MILVSDIGNTNIVFGIFQDNILKSKFRLMTRPIRTLDEYAFLIINLLKQNGIDKSELKGVIVAGVVDNLDIVLKNAFERYFNLKTFIVKPTDDLGIENKYETPDTLGIDRIVNCIAGYNKYKTSLIVIDAGTATTVDIILKGEGFLGGLILPGMDMLSKSLFENTSKLPFVALRKTNEIIGKNTIDSINSGVVFGYASMLEGIVKKIKEKYFKYDIKVLITGGKYKTISDISDIADFTDEDLTLKGLKIIYDYKEKNEFQRCGDKSFNRE